VGYFKSSLRELYEEFKVVFNEDENKIFHRLFEEELTIDSIPSFFFQFIDVGMFLLNKIKAQKKDLGKDDKDKEKEKKETRPRLKINVNDVGKRRARVAKALSTFQCIPLEVASKSFSFRSIKDCLKAEKVGSKFFLNSTVNHLNTFETIEVTKDVSKMEFKIGDEITRKNITQNISHLKFTGIKSHELAKETVANLLAVAKKFENIQEMSFKGNCVYTIFGSAEYGHEFHEFSEAMLYLTQTCQKLKHIVFLTKFSNYIQKDKIRVNNLLKELSSIDKITLKCVQSGETFHTTHIREL